MLSFFKRKKELPIERVLKEEGIDGAARIVSESIIKKLPTRELALQFILEDIEAAAMGNAAAIRFARESGFEPSEYEGAMDRSTLAVDGPNGPQQTLNLLFSPLLDKPEVLVPLRTAVDDYVMRFFSLGKYAGRPPSIRNPRLMLNSDKSDIAFVVDNDVVIYKSDYIDDLFEHQEGSAEGGEVFGGRLAAFNLRNASNPDEVIRIFVAFSESDARRYFAAARGVSRDLDAMAVEAFRLLANIFPQIFSSSVQYRTQYEFTFYLMRAEGSYLLSNTTHTQNYVIDGVGFFEP